MPTESRPLAEYQRRILYCITVVAIAIACGTVGFHLIEGWTLLDSLYVAAQTVTTVGYGDISPRTTNGRLFSIIFMLGGVGVVLYALTATVQAVVQSELIATLGQSNRFRSIACLLCQ